MLTVSKGLGNLDDASPFGPPRGLLLGAGQSTEEQQLLDVEQRLWEIPQQEAPLPTGGSH